MYKASVDLSQVSSEASYHHHPSHQHGASNFFEGIVQQNSEQPSVLALPTKIQGNVWENSTRQEVFAECASQSVLGSQENRKKRNRDNAFEREQRSKMKQENDRLFLRIAEAKSDLKREGLLRGAEKSFTMKARLTQLKKDGQKTFGEKMLEKLDVEQKNNPLVRKTNQGAPFKMVADSTNRDEDRIP